MASSHQGDSNANNNNNSVSQSKENENENENENKEDSLPSDKELKALYKVRITGFTNVAYFPTESNAIFKKNLIANALQDMKTVYPICHGSTLLLAYKMLQFKRKYGSNSEKTVYKAMNPAQFTIVDFMDRIATKRAIYFLNPSDTYLLRSGRSGSGGWGMIGTDRENKKDFKLANYMSYDEMMLSAMCGISSMTQFVNAGSRNNCGRRDTKNTFIERGIYMGMIGARFEKPGYMEHSLMTVDDRFTSVARGFGIQREATIKDLNNNVNKHNNNYKQSNNNNNNFLNHSDINIDDIYASTESDTNNINNNDTTKDNTDTTNDAKNANDTTNNANIFDENDANDPNTANVSNGNNNNNNAMETDTKENDKGNSEELVENIEELTEYDINAKFIDLLCEWYGNVGFIPTYNELNQLFGQSSQYEKRGSKNKDDDLSKLCEYLNQRYVSQQTYWSGKTYFDVYLFKIRMRVSLEIFLFDSDFRTKNDPNHNLAYCHLVGLGLGVWTLHGFKTHETQLFVECVKDIIEETNLPHIGAIDFSWFDKIAPFSDDFGNVTVFEMDNKQRYVCKDASGKHEIEIIFSKRNPADLLAPRYSQYKLCAMYAWDGNAQPGNEYYMGSLAASGDPAAACCSTIPYIQNSMINKEFINGSNTHVYFRDAKDLKNYKRMRLKDIQDTMQPAEWMELAQNSIPYYNKLPNIDIKKYLQ